MKLSLSQHWTGTPRVLRPSLNRIFTLLSIMYWKDWDADAVEFYAQRAITVTALNFVVTAYWHLPK